LRFDSANYPEDFMRLLGASAPRGETRLEWLSASLALVRVLPADSVMRSPPEIVTAPDRR
jgi:hypothetical protein